MRMSFQNEITCALTKRQMTSLIGADANCQKKKEGASRVATLLKQTSGQEKENFILAYNTTIPHGNRRAREEISSIDATIFKKGIYNNT